MNLMKENNLIRKICFILAIIVVIIIAMYAYNKAKISEELARTIIKEKFELCRYLMYPSERYYTISEEYVIIDGCFCYEIEDYEEINIENLQVFADTITLQNLELIPLSELPEYWIKSETFNTPPQNL